MTLGQAELKGADCARTRETCSATTTTAGLASIVAINGTAVTRKLREFQSYWHWGWRWEKIYVSPSIGRVPDNSHPRQSARILQDLPAPIRRPRFVACEIYQRLHSFTQGAAKSYVL